MRAEVSAWEKSSLNEPTVSGASCGVFDVGSNAFPFNSEVFIIFRRFQEAR
jgi:hypothetical protein